MPLVKIEKQTVVSADSATAVDFESLGTAHELLFTWLNFDPTGGSDDTLTFQVTTDDTYSYDAPIQSVYHRAYHNEADSTANILAYSSGSQSNDTGLQWIGTYVDQDQGDSSGSGELRLFSHTSTSLVKNFISRSNTETGSATLDAHVGGYINTTEAITKVRFKALAGGTFTGVFTLYEYTTS